MLERTQSQYDAGLKYLLGTYSAAGEDGPGQCGILMENSVPAATATNGPTPALDIGSLLGGWHDGHGLAGDGQDAAFSTDGKEGHGQCGIQMAASYPVFLEEAASTGVNTGPGICGIQMDYSVSDRADDAIESFGSSSGDGPGDGLCGIQIGPLFPVVKAFDVAQSDGGWDVHHATTGAVDGFGFMV